ncbi:hypothetical protein LB526_09190 [Mesorhizobium sp. CA6]|nr:hypothetical protein [Mesorhizobium sp. CA6]MBZ9766932.1 hypothetical protein [Mesorhizobium sp. CA6]
MLSFLLLTARQQFAPSNRDHQENQIPDPRCARNLFPHGRARPLITLAYQRWLEIAFPLSDLGGGCVRLGNTDIRLAADLAAGLTLATTARESVSLNSLQPCHKRRKFSMACKV